MEVGKLDFNSITGLKELDQSRALRLVLAVIEDDFVQLGAVAEEVYQDERSEAVAVWELIIGLAGSLAHIWGSTLDSDSLIAKIREVLIENAGEQ